jgi:hypothetical protein
LNSEFNQARLASFTGHIAHLCIHRREISLNHGATWKRLIRRYIGTIPPSTDPPGIAGQSMSGPAPPHTPEISAMIAKLGAAASATASVTPLTARGVTFVTLG